MVEENHFDTYGSTLEIDKYKCPTCGYEEKVQLHDDDMQINCPECNAKLSIQIRKVVEHISNVAVSTKRID